MDSKKASPSPPSKPPKRGLTTPKGVKRRRGRPAKVKEGVKGTGKSRTNKTVPARPSLTRDERMAARQAKTTELNQETGSSAEAAAGSLRRSERIRKRGKLK